MKNLLIISSKKYLSKKVSKDIFKIIEKNNFSYQIVDIDSDEIKKLKKGTADLIISIGGDGTALKAMRLAWKFKKHCERSRGK